MARCDARGELPRGARRDRPYADEITAEIPRDATWIGTVYRARNASGAGQFDVPANADIGVSADETANCDR